MIAARRESVPCPFLPPFPRKHRTYRFRWCYHVYPSDGGSADPDKNIALLNVIRKARADGVPKANIENALQKVRMCIFSRRTVPLVFFFIRGLTWIIYSCCARIFRILLRSMLVFSVVLGCRWEGRGGPADNVRGACAWFCRTYHVRTYSACACPSSPVRCTDS